MIRDLRPDDIPILKRWHEESGFDYPFPELEKKDFEALRVLVDEADRPVQFVAARKTVEIYLLIDPNWRNPRWRLDGVMQVHEDVRSILESKGIQDVHAWLPPEFEKSFGRRLQRIFGWVPARWKSYSRKVRQ